MSLTSQSPCVWSDPSFDRQQWNDIFSTVLQNVTTLAAVGSGSASMPYEEFKQALIFREASSILGLTYNLYRFQKELQFYDEEDI